MEQANLLNKKIGELTKIEQELNSMASTCSDYLIVLRYGSKKEIENNSIVLSLKDKLLKKRASLDSLLNEYFNLEL